MCRPRTAGVRLSCSPPRSSPLLLVFSQLRVPDTDPRPSFFISLLARSLPSQSEPHLDLRSMASTSIFLLFFFCATRRVGLQTCRASLDGKRKVLQSSPANLGWSLPFFERPKTCLFKSLPERDSVSTRRNVLFRLWFLSFLVLLEPSPSVGLPPFDRQKFRVFPLCQLLSPHVLAAGKV